MFGTKRTNIIIPGEFYGEDDSHGGISCSLTIKEITKKQFLAAKGINVIEDQVKQGNYYSIVFQAVDPTGFARHYDFVNLQDAFDGATGTPISYEDEQDYWVTPYTSLNNEVQPYEDSYYGVHLTNSNKDLEIGVYLYPDVS